MITKCDCIFFCTLKGGDAIDCMFLWIIISKKEGVFMINNYEETEDAGSSLYDGAACGFSTKYLLHMVMANVKSLTFISLTYFYLF